MKHMIDVKELMLTSEEVDTPWKRVCPCSPIDMAPMSSAASSSPSSAGEMSPSSLIREAMASTSGIFEVSARSGCGCGEICACVELKAASSSRMREPMLLTACCSV